MQVRVARELPAIVPVSESSRRDISSQMQVKARALDGGGRSASTRPVFRPIEGSAVPGRIMVTSSE